MTIRRSLAVVAGACAAMLSPAAAQAAVCGAPAPAGEQPVRGVLTLDRESDTDATFKQGTGKRSINLIYAVSGCTVDGLADPTVKIVSRKGADDIPEGAVVLTGTTLAGSELEIALQADSDKFDPGAYGGLVQVRAPYLVTTRTAIDVSRSEDSWAIPLGIGAIAGIFALIWFYITRRATKDGFHMKGWKAWTGATLVTMAAGAIAAWTSYKSQDVWVLGDNWRATAFAAFTGATTGSMLVLLTALGRAPAPNPPAPEPPPEPAPAPGPA